MSECVPLVKFGRYGRREALIPHVNTTFSNRRPARDGNVSVHRTVLGTTDNCAEVNVFACSIKSDSNAEPCVEWNCSSGCWEVPVYHGKGCRAGDLKPVRSRHLS